MPQAPFSMNTAIDPDGVRKPLNVDADGNLIVASASGGDAVTIANGADVTQGALTDSPWALGPTASVIALLKTIATGVLGFLRIKAAGLKYVTVAAGQTAQALGTGAIGDTINTLIIVPALAAGGVVTLIDGTGGGAVTIPIYVGGAVTALPSLAPITVRLDAVSAAGGWHITTGASISVVAVGQFTP